MFKPVGSNHFGVTAKGMLSDCCNSEAQVEVDILIPSGFPVEIQKKLSDRASTMMTWQSCDHDRVRIGCKRFFLFPACTSFLSYVSVLDARYSYFSRTLVPVRNANKLDYRVPLSNDRKPEVSQGAQDDAGTLTDSRVPTHKRSDLLEQFSVRYGWRLPIELAPRDQTLGIFPECANVVVPSLFL